MAEAGIEGFAPNCPRCERPMRLVGVMPETTNLPRLTTYHCEPCNEVCVLENRKPGP